MLFGILRVQSTEHKGAYAMKYQEFYINGDKVSEERYETDRNDNYNLSIQFDEQVVGRALHMTYGDPQDANMCVSCQ